MPGSALGAVAASQGLAKGVEGGALGMLFGARERRDSAQAHGEADETHDPCKFSLSVLSSALAPVSSSAKCLTSESKVLL